MAKLFYVPFQPIFGPRGLPVGAATVTFYLSQTTTLATIYSDSNLSVPLANPVKADASGKLPTIYMPDTATYRVIIRDAAGGMMGQAIDPYIPGTYPRGEDGKSIDPPFRYRMVASAGQRTFPVAGQTVYQVDANGNETSFIATAAFPQEYDPSTLAVIINGLTIKASDYTAPGGTQPVVFDDTDGLLAATEVEFGGYIAAGSGAGGSTPALDELSLSDFPRQAGETQDMPRFKRLKAAALAAGKGMFIPAGTYTIGENGQNADPTASGFLFGSGIRIRGAGRLATKIQKAAGFPYIWFCNPVGIGTSNSPDTVGPGDAGMSVGNRVSGIGFSDDVVSLGFSEQEALLHLNAIQDCKVTDCGFTGFRGDAIYVGSGDIGGGPQVRHNRDVLIQYNVFDGVNNNNRQAVSVVDGVRVRILDNEVYRTTKPGNGNVTPLDPMDPNTGFGMPGAFDFEPNTQFTKDVTCYDNEVSRNYVEDNGGSLVAFFLATGQRPSEITHPMTGFIFRDNTAVRCRRGLQQLFGPEQAVIPFDVRSDGNRDIDCFRPNENLRFRGITENNRTSVGGQYSAFSGYAGSAMRDWTRNGCRSYRCGLNDGLVTSLEGGSDITWNSEAFDDCNGTAVAIRGSTKLYRFRAPNIHFYNSGESGAPNLVNSFTVIRNADSGGTPTETVEQAINRLVDCRTFELPGAVFNGVNRPNFPYLNGTFPAIPQVGEWKAGDRVYIRDETGGRLEDGAPDYVEAYAPNTLPAKPLWKVGAQQGFAPADPTVADIANIGMTSGVVRGPNNRFTAKMADQRIWIPTSFGLASSLPGAEIIIRVPYSRTAFDFFGLMRRTQAPTDFAADFSVTGLDNFSGIWTDGGPQGSLSMQQVDDGNTLRQMLTPWFYGQEWKIWFKSNSARPELKVAKKVNGTFVQQGATIQLDAQAANGDLYYPYFQLGAAGDTFQLLSIAAAGNFPQ